MPKCDSSYTINAVSFWLAIRTIRALVQNEGGGCCGENYRRDREFTYAHDRLRARPQETGRPDLDADLRGLRADPALARREAARRARDDLQRSCHLVLFRSLLRVRPQHRRGVPGGGRGRRRARAPG